MVPPGGIREKSSGVLMPTAPPEAKKHPRHPLKAFRGASSPSPNLPSKKRGLRGNMVPFPAALCAAGTPMGWTLVAPFLELPPSCAALAALANRARPAVRCRTTLPQKRRDCGGPGGAFHLPVGHLAFTPPGAFSLGPLQRPVLFSREKRMGGWEAPLLEGVTSAPLWAHRKVWPRIARNGSRPTAALFLRLGGEAATALLGRADECRRRRREPPCGATGVYFIKGVPTAPCAVGKQKEKGLLRGIIRAAIPFFRSIL